MKEIWKPVKGWEDLYLISNFGRVKALSKTLIYSDGRKYHYPERILKISPVPEGKYPTIHFYRNKERTTLAIHRLVAEAFVPNPENKPTVNHKDGNKRNNRVDNLEWATYSENNVHALDEGLKKQTPEGMESKLAKLNKDQVKALYSSWIPRTSGKNGTKYFAQKFGVTPTTIRKYINRKIL